MVHQFFHVAHKRYVSSYPSMLYRFLKIELKIWLMHNQTSDIQTFAYIGFRKCFCFPMFVMLKVLPLTYPPMHLFCHRSSPPQVQIYNQWHHMKTFAWNWQNKWQCGKMHCRLTALSLEYLFIVNIMVNFNEFFNTNNWRWF